MNNTPNGSPIFYVSVEQLEEAAALQEAVTEVNRLWKAVEDAAPQKEFAALEAYRKAYDNACDSFGNMRFLRAFEDARPLTDTAH